MRDWLQQLFPRLTLETSKLDTNAPESICLLDLEASYHYEKWFERSFVKIRTILTG